MGDSYTKTKMFFYFTAHIMKTYYTFLMLVYLKNPIIDNFNQLK